MNKTTAKMWKKILMSKISRTNKGKIKTRPSQRMKIARRRASISNNRFKKKSEKMTAKTNSTKVAQPEVRRNNRSQNKKCNNPLRKWEILLNRG